jgi:hypothetical protein
VLPREPPLALETRARKPVHNEIRLERPKAALDASVALFGSLFPNARLRSLTAVYNCIGMIVANRRVWVDPEDLIRVLREDGYRRLASAAEAEPGDVVAYHDRHGEVCHAGIVVARRVLVPGDDRDLLIVLSKWGADGEYVHASLELPGYLGAPEEFWTDRRGT